MMLWFGACRDWRLGLRDWLPPATHHLAEDMARFLPMTFTVHPPARDIWNEISDGMIDFIFQGIPRALSLGGGSLSEVFQMIESDSDLRRFVEIGGYEGGSILALVLRFSNRDMDFHSVESFMGNLDGTMDGHRLPVRTRFEQNVARFPSVRVRVNALSDEIGAPVIQSSIRYRRCAKRWGFDWRLRRSSLYAGSDCKWRKTVSSQQTGPRFR